MATSSKELTTPSEPTTRPTSLLSPTRHSRLLEKTDLQNLNDRLACYIDKVRYSEAEDNRLKVQTTQETVTREVSNIKSIYDHELSDSRRLINETHREKAKLEIDTKRVWDENEELKATLTKKSKALSLAEINVRVLETRNNDLTVKYNQTQSDAKKAIAEARDLEKERDKLRKQVDELRKQLEEESLARVYVENNNQSLRADLCFKEQVFQQQLSETRTRRQVEISENDGRLAEQYESKFQQALQDLRDQYETQITKNRQEIEMLYENKIKNLQTAVNRHSETASAATDELRQVRTQIDTLSNRVIELEGLNSSLLNRANDLEKMLENERLRHAEDLALVESEATRLREEMTKQLQDYQDLMDIKVSLDLEISAYRKLLESAEVPLNIAPPGSAELVSRSTSSGSQRRTPVRIGSKRKRTLHEESQESLMSEYSVKSSSKDDVKILEACPEGKFVMLHNKSNKEINLKGWQVVRKAGNLKSLYKFHRSVKMDPNVIITIWSSDQGKDDDPPSSLVMNGQKWLVADNMTTTVINASGDEIAVSERVNRQIPSARARLRKRHKKCQIL